MDESVFDSDPVAAGEPVPAVSFAGEELIAVDSEDRPTGFATKEAMHAGGGQLHRAFSIFLIDSQQRVLLHRRSVEKPLWPGYWTNSCCSHPRRGEGLEDAVHRRLREELGVRAARLRRVYAFEYSAAFRDRGTEHEYCHVFLAQPVDARGVAVHSGEIMDWGWYAIHDVDALLVDAPEMLTPWFRLEWIALRSTHADAFNAFLRAPQADPRSAA